MTTAEDIGFPVQETSGEVDSRSFKETPLSTEETNCSQDSMDFSRNTLKSKASEAFEDQSKTFEGTSTEENPSTDLQDSSVQEALRFDDHPLTSALEDDASIVSIHHSPEGHRSNNRPIELFELGHNGDVGNKPSDDILDHHEVSNSFFATSHTGENASNYKLDDDTSYITTRCSKMQIIDNTLEEGRMADFAESDPSDACSESDKNAFMSPEDKTSTARRRDDKDFSCRRSNINETDAKIEIIKAFDATSLKDITSTSLQQEDNVTDVIIPDGHTTMNVKSEESTPAIFEEDNFAIENCGQESMDFSCNTPKSSASDEDQSKTFEGTSIEENTSTDLQDSSVQTAVRFNDPTMSCALENNASIVSLNLSPEGYRSNNRPRELFELGHNGDVCKKPSNDILDHHEVSNSFSAAGHTGGNTSNSKIDDNTTYITTCWSKLQIIGNTCKEGGRADFAESDSSNAHSESDKNAFMSPAVETSTDGGRDDKDFLCRRSNINETDAKEEIIKAFDGTSLKDIASTGLQQDGNVTDVISPDGHTTMNVKSEESIPAIFKEDNFAIEDCMDFSCNTPKSSASDEDQSKTFEGTSIEENASTDLQDSSVQTAVMFDDPTMSCALENNASIVSLNLSPEGHRSNNRPRELFELGHNGDMGSGPIDHGCNQSTSIFRSYDDNNRDAYIRRSEVRGRRNNCKRRGNATFTNRKPNDRISSGHGRHNFSDHKPNRHRQSWDTQRSCNSLATTNPAYFHQGGIVPIVNQLDNHVSLPRESEICNSLGTKIDKQHQIGRFLKKIISIFSIMMMFLIAPILAEASPVQSPGQWCWFHKADGSLFNQVLKIKGTDFTFNFTAVSYFVDVSQSGFWFTAKNETYVEMLTTNLSTEDWIMEYGRDLIGKILKKDNCVKLNKTSMKTKKAEFMANPQYTEAPDRSTKPGPDGDSSAAMWIGVGVFLGVVAGVAVFGLLYRLRPQFRSWVRRVVPYCGGRNNNENYETGANADHNSTAVHLMSHPSTNGDITRPQEPQG